MESRSSCEPEGLCHFDDAQIETHSSLNSASSSLNTERIIFSQMIGLPHIALPARLFHRTPFELCYCLKGYEK